MKLIMENWRGYLSERKMNLHVESTSLLIGMWIRDYMRGKKYKASSIEISSTNDKENHSIKNKYEGDNAYFEVLSNLIQIRDQIAGRRFNLRDLQKILKDNNRPDVEGELSGLIKKVGEIYRTKTPPPQSSELIQRGKSATISWEHDIDSEMTTSGDSSKLRSRQKQHSPIITEKISTRHNSELIMENWKKFLKEQKGATAQKPPGPAPSQRVEIQNKKGQILVVHVKPNFVTYAGQTHQRVKATVDPRTPGGPACGGAEGDGKDNLSAIQDAVKRCSWISIDVDDIQRALRGLKTS